MSIARDSGLWFAGLGVVAILLVAGGWAFAHFIYHRIKPTPVAVPSTLQTLWQAYKKQSWESIGKSVDHANNSVTTSEGQGYTMLRAVWMNDQTAFNSTWNWTETNLQRSDKLFSWRWGTRSDGSIGVLTDQGGQNSASDADTDIALALLMAAQRWHSANYKMQAQAIISAIWDQEVVTINGKTYMTADNVEKTSPAPNVVINPSYFAPYAYRVFAKLDSAHDWTALAANCYDLLQQASHENLDTSRSSGLPPDWINMNRTTGQLSATGNPGQTTDFGFDAFRTVWRTALDWEWFHASEAKQALDQWSALQNDWSAQHELFATYGHDGQTKVNYTSLALYGGTLGYFQIDQPDDGKIMYRSELASLFNPSTHQPTKALTYYDNNWVWFGIALYTNKLPNLSGVSS